MQAVLLLRGRVQHLTLLAWRLVPTSQQCKIQSTHLCHPERLSLGVMQYMRCTVIKSPSKFVQENAKRGVFVKILHRPSFLLTSIPSLPPPLPLRHLAHRTAAILQYPHKAPLNLTQGSPTSMYITEAPRLYQTYRPYQ